MASVRPARFQLFSFDDDPQGFWVAEERDEIVGSAFSWICGNLWFLAELFVAPGKQGSGIGRELLARSFKHADQAGAQKRALITFTFNVVSQGLYLRHGLFPRLPLYLFSGDQMGRDGNASDRIEVNPLNGSETSALAALDNKALGVSREKHHALLLNDSEMQGFLFCVGGQPIGYAYVANTGHVGPLAVASHNWMRPALDTALDIAGRQSQQVSAFLPGICEEAFAIASKRRMRITLPMVLVSNHDFGDWRCYLPRNPGFM
jgi:hypothetical protein